jgi:hypothetical protein
MGPTELVALVVLVVAGAVWIGRRGAPATVTDWAVATGVVVSCESAPVVERYLNRSRRARRVGALVGFLSPWLYAAASGREVDEGAWALTLMLAGYMLGAVIAEITVDRSNEGASAAVVQARRLDDYLPGWIVGLQRALGIASLGLLLPYALAMPADELELPGIGLVATFALGGALIAAIAEMLERHIIARRQSFADIDDVAVDDAIRSTSLHMVAGAALALLIQFVGPLSALTVVAALPDTRSGAAGIVGGVLIILAFIVSIGCWLTVARPAPVPGRGLRGTA